MLLGRYVRFGGGRRKIIRGAVTTGQATHEIVELSCLHETWAGRGVRHSLDTPYNGFICSRETLLPSAQWTGQSHDR